jgi:hypothetical protein
MSYENRPNGHATNSTIGEKLPSEADTSPAGEIHAGGQVQKVDEVATRTKLRAKEQLQQNRFVIIGAGVLVVALLIFVAISMPGKHASDAPKRSASVGSHKASQETSPSQPVKSLLPVTDAGRPAAQESRDGMMSEEDLNRTVTAPRPSVPTKPNPAQRSSEGTLESVPPFGEQGWQAPPYQAGRVANSPEPQTVKTEHEASEKSSLVYVRTGAASQGKIRGEEPANLPGLNLGIGLPTGTRLRARLEAAASTAVRTPVLAVIEYNYERDGEIIVPAGAKASGHMQEADRSGYVRIQFDSLLMPDGEELPIQAVATNLDMRPLRGKVEGKNTGKNVLVRSLTGVGEVGAMLVGRRNLDQTLSESDLLRERLGDNIGQAGDQQIASMAITQHIVVTIPADTSVYVVFEKPPKSNNSTNASRSPAEAGSAVNAEQLRQLLQLQRELNQGTTPSEN